MIAFMILGTARTPPVGAHPPPTMGKGEVQWSNSQKGMCRSGHNFMTEYMTHTSKDF